MGGTGFLAIPEPTARAQPILDGDIEQFGFVMNATRIWAYQPDSYRAIFDLMDTTRARAGLSDRQRAILIAAGASAFGDAYCSLGWGALLSGLADPDTAAAVLRGSDTGLDAREQALAAWARQVARDPNAVAVADVARLRDAGYTDAEIFAITLFVALRVAFSTVNDAVGAQPDARLRDLAPDSVAESITFGRPVDDD